MGKFNFILISVLAFILMSAVVSAVPTINDVYVEQPDEFYSSCSGNDVLDISVNATSGVAILAVVANFSQVNENIAIDCNGSGVDTIYLTNTGGDIWEGSCNLSAEAAVSDFESGPVIVVAADGSGSSPDNTDLQPVLYNMTTPPPSQNSCEKNGDQVTKMCEVTNFSGANFVFEVETNGSEDCNGGQELPWGDTFQKVITLNFTSVNFTDPNINQKLSNLDSAIIPYITPPGMFGDSYIFVNSTSFAALDTNTQITLYGIPFGEVPAINGESGAVAVDTFTGGSAIIEINCSDICIDEGYCSDESYSGDTCTTCISECIAEGEAFNMTVPSSNLTFTVAGFSQYNVSDNETPTTIIHTPSANQITGTSVLLNVTANGTGSQISNLTFMIDGAIVESYSNSDLFEYCTGTDDWEVVTCNITATGGAAGEHTFRIMAFDLGGVSPGNYNFSEVNFTVDATQPVINYVAKNATSAYVGDDIYISSNWTESTLSQENMTCTLYVNDVANETITSDGSWCNFTYSPIDADYSSVEFKVKASDMYSNEATSSSIGTTTVYYGCGSTITATTTLNADLPSNCANGLTIAASGITLDCNNYIIDGNNAGNGISLDGYDNVIIKNCNVSQFAENLYIRNSENSQLIDNHIRQASAPSSGISLYRALNTEVSGNLIDSMNNVGMTLTYSNSSNIHDNTIRQNIYSGIFISGGSYYNNIYSNSIVNTQRSGEVDGWGLYLDQATDTKIYLNNISGNQAHGIYLDDEATGTKIYSNSIYSNNGGAGNDQIYVHNDLLPMDLNYNGKGNFWGHTSCPLFDTEIDTNQNTNVTDHLAYNQDYYGQTWPTPDAYYCQPTAEVFDTVGGVATIPSNSSLTIYLANLTGLNTTNATVDVLNLTQGGSVPSGTVIFYLNITTNTTGASNITFKVHNNTINTIGASTDRIFVYADHGSGYGSAISTSYLGTEGEYHFFRFTTSEYSVFTPTYIAATSPQTPSGGGGGSSGGGFYYTEVTLTGTKIISGMNDQYRLKFDVGRVQHTLSTNLVGNDYVEFEIYSTPSKFRVDEGSTKSVDVDGDGEKDIGVKVSTIYGKSFDATFSLLGASAPENVVEKEISLQEDSEEEVVVIEESEDAEETAPEKRDEEHIVEVEKTPRDSSLTLIVGAILIGLIIAGGYFFVLKKK